MSIGLAISGLLYPTVGLALFAAWRYASVMAYRGRTTVALLIRVSVVLVSCWPLAWVLHRIYADLGWEALWKSSGAACVAIFLYLLAFRLRSYLERRSVRRCR